MARGVIFDPTDKAAFSRQRERYDWHLLQNGAIHRVDTDEQLERAGALLAGLGYGIHRLDASNWNDSAAVYDSFASSFDFPAGGGRNLDALQDWLRDVAEFDYGSDPESCGTAVLVTGNQGLVERDRRLSEGLLHVCEETARYALVLGHPMLFLFSCPVPMTGRGRVPLDHPLSRVP